MNKDAFLKTANVLICYQYYLSEIKIIYAKKKC